MTRLQVSTLGTFAGLAGIEHGIGEILQGNTAPAGIMFPSWPESELFRVLAGEPAMSLIPNFLLSGMLTLLFSAILITWSLVFVHRKHGGSILMLLSVVLLFIGGGFGPPLLGIIVGAAGTRINTPLSWWRARFSAPVRKVFSKASPWIFAACVIAWLCMIPGSILLGHLLGGESAAEPASSTHVLYFMATAFALLPLTIVAGFARDIEKRETT